MQGKPELALKRIEPTSYVFNKDHLLGKGAFGEVYLGYDEAHRQPIAIKTISNQKINKVSSNEQPLKQKIAGELGNMQICRSERLVQLISPHQYFSLYFDSSSKNIYVVCEYCNGGSLKDYLAKKRVLSEFETLLFIKDILEGLKCLHQRKVVHRDMKPANLLLHNRRIKIGDLGFSKSISVHEEILVSTVGTPLYMSPQILSNTTYTEKTDIWSLGILLYEMLVGEVPWRVNSIQQIKQKVRHKPQFPRNFVISNSTRTLIMSMLQMQQKHRISFDQLFKQYLPTSSISQIQAQQPLLPQKCHLANQHFLSSLSLQSQSHIIYMLQKNNRKIVDSLHGYQNGRQFFHKLGEMKQERKLIQGVVNLYVQCRNQVAFFMRIFFQAFVNCEELGGVVVFAAMFMVVKCAIAKVEDMLGNFANGVPYAELFYKSTYYANLRELLVLDLQILTQLFKHFKQQLFFPKMNLLLQTNPAQVATTQKDLKPFLVQQSVSVKFTEFVMRNQCRQLFNAFKDAEKLEDRWLLIPRLIYEYEKADKTHIFANLGEKANMNKKLEEWAFEERWKGKFRELKKFPIQSLASFINREVQWGPFSLLNFPIPNPNIQ